MALLGEDERWGWALLIRGGGGAVTWDPAPWEAADTEFLFLPWTQRLPLLCGGAKAQQTQVMVMVMP